MRIPRAERLQKVVGVLRAPQLLDAAADEMTRLNLKARLPPCPPASHFREHGTSRKRVDTPCWAGGEEEAAAAAAAAAQLGKPPLELRPTTRWWDRFARSDATQASPKVSVGCVLCVWNPDYRYICSMMRILLTIGLAPSPNIFDSHRREYRLVSHDVMNFALDPAGGDALVVHHSAANR